MDIRGDDRGQAVQIGSILLFAMAVMAFSGYQAFAVPNQNADVEFNHYTGVRDDVEDVRNAVIAAGERGTKSPASVDLGTTYPARRLASQPRSSWGTLRTERLGTGGIELSGSGATVSDICGFDTVTTRSAVYEPSYNYFTGVENVTYENTLVYTNTRDGQAFHTEQQLVDNTTISLYPLVGAYEESGDDVATITFKAGRTGVNESVPGAFDLRLPTRLSAATWTERFEETGADRVTGVADVPGEQAVDVSFEAGYTYEISCTPSGAGSTPANTPTVGVETDDINPAAPGDIQLIGYRQANGNRGRIELRYQNLANASINVTAARVAFFQGDSNPNKWPETFVIYNGTNPTSQAGTLGLGETFESLDPEVFFPANDTRVIRLDLQRADGSAVKLSNVKDGWFVLTVQFETGETGKYFVPVPDDTSF